MAKKFEVEIIEAKGSCSNEQIQAVLKAGDLSSSSVKEHIGEIVKIGGFIHAKITTDTKEFENVYYATNNGFYSSGSMVLKDSVSKYYNVFDKLQIVEVKVKNNSGVTYKVSPVLDTEEVA